jgi:exodeoxyribonuclease X
MFVVIDSETTGQDPTKDGVVEFGYALTDLERTWDVVHSLVNPGVAITAEASAVHHLVDDDVKNERPLREVVSKTLANWDAARDAVAYVAHNAPFDRSFLPMLTDKPWLDTLRMARRYYPELPKHSNQVLRYHFKLALSDEERALPAHRVSCDCAVTAALLRHLLNGPARDDFERLGVAGFAEHIDSPLVLTVCNFGKHVGKKWAEVPRDYLAWILRQPDFDPDVRFTALNYLNGK